MEYAFVKATKGQGKARVMLSGPSGSGKTYSALAMATAMCDRVAVIDTEHGSAAKYADVFDFDVLDLAEFHPNSYIQAIRAATKHGYDGLVIDSISHEWFGTGGCLELVDQYARREKAGNKFAGWASVTPLHNRFIESLHQADTHLFATVRSKMDYIIDGGKIRKVGMDPIQRDGMEYEFDVFLELDLDHVATVVKSRCVAMADQTYIKPGPVVATVIANWLSDGVIAIAEPIADVVVAYDRRVELLDSIPNLATAAGISIARVNAQVSRELQQTGLVVDSYAEAPTAYLEQLANRLDKAARKGD